MFSTYKPEDVTILLKDISGMVEPLPTKVREKYIQSGVHYSEMLPLEYEPSPAYLDAYKRAVDLYSEQTARAVATVAGKIYAEKAKDVVLVSLARAGTPIGILLKRYMKSFYGLDVPHYTISIIRGKGIDQNAMRTILKKHPPQSIQFVDGWTGKGAIQNQLKEAMQDYPDVDPLLAVLSDPAHVAGKSGTYHDFLIASSLLNSTVSGLLSRTFYRKDIIGPDDFHGAVFYSNLMDQDLTYHFISSVEKHFDSITWPQEGEQDVKFSSGIAEVREIAEKYSIVDLNLIKPSIGEATRVLLRRMPWKMLVHSLEDHEYLGHLYQLASEKRVEVEEYPLKNYRACGIIKKLADT